MPTDRRKILGFGAAVCLRLAVFLWFPQWADMFAGQVEVSTPLNSFKRLQEGLFLYNHNASPYEGGIFHQAPLLLSIFSLFPTGPLSSLLTGLLYTILDMINALALGKIAESGESSSTRLFTSPRRDVRLDGITVSIVSLLNPFTIASCLGRSTSIFTNTAIIHAVSSAIDGQGTSAMLALAFASYFSLYPFLLFPPLVLLHYDRVRKESDQKLSFFASLDLSFLLGFLLALFLLSFAITGSWEFVGSTYGFHLSVPDLTPNVGLWWYFFIEIFDSFREFFLGVFWLHLACYTGGLTLRLRSQPLFVITTLLGIFAIFKPYPSISDLSLYLEFVPLYWHLFSLMRYTFLATSVMLYASLLGPAFYYLWIYAGSGNANFFYAITLVWSLGLSMLVGDMLFAALRDEWEVERPEMRGKEVRRI